MSGRHSLGLVGGVAALALAVSGPGPAWAGGGAPPLVTVEEALRSASTVSVAVTVEPGSVAERDVAGSPGVGFVGVGPGGARLEAELVGKLPAGADVAELVALVGSAAGGRFRVERVLLPQAARPAAPDGGRGLKAVLAVTMVVWVGLFFYVLAVDRRVRRLEE